MPECHTCPHDGKRRRVCLTCKSTDQLNHRHRSFVSLDSAQQGAVQTWAEVQAALVRGIESGGIRPTSRRATDQAAAAAFVMRLFNLDDRTLRIVRYLVLHPHAHLTTVARRHRVSVQALHSRLKRLAVAWPGVRVMLGRKLER